MDRSNGTLGCESTYAWDKRINSKKQENQSRRMGVWPSTPYVPHRTVNISSQRDHPKTGVNRNPNHEKHIPKTVNARVLALVSRPRARPTRVYTFNALKPRPLTQKTHLKPQYGLSTTSFLLNALALPPALRLGVLIRAPGPAGAPAILSLVGRFNALFFSMPTSFGNATTQIPIRAVAEVVGLDRFAVPLDAVWVFLAL